MLLCVITMADAQAFYCGERIVSVGDSKADVLLKCGEPASKDARDEEYIEKTGIESKRKTRVTIEDWTYNAGPDALVRILTFNNGKLADVREGGRGFDSRAASPNCGDSLPEIGENKAQVRMRCGEPFARESRTEEIIDALDMDTKRKTVIAIDEWTYNFGPNSFIRFFQFRNGRLVDIKTGGYGK